MSANSRGTAAGNHLKGYSAKCACPYGNAAPVSLGRLIRGASATPAQRPVSPMGYSVGSA
jgi:hypothetical protein